MNYCQYDPETLTCKTCGHVARVLPTFRKCKPVPPRPVTIPRDDGLSVKEAQRRTRGLGDMTADSLAAIGITKERVAYWFGNCGCEARQEWLNEVGRVFGIGTGA